MIRIGIIGENFRNDACAFKAFLTPQYEGKIELVPLFNSFSKGVPAFSKIIRSMPTEIQKQQLDALLCMLDLDEHRKRGERNQWFKEIQKGISIRSIFFLAVMELEALILADIDTFNKIYGITGRYDKDPKLNTDPKKELRGRTDLSSKAKRKYEEKHAFEIFEKLHFDIVYKKHNEDDSFQAFIDRFEAEFHINPTTKERLKKTKGKER